MHITTIRISDGRTNVCTEYTMAFVKVCVQMWVSRRVAGKSSVCADTLAVRTFPILFFSRGSLDYSIPAVHDVEVLPSLSVRVVLRHPTVFSMPPTTIYRDLPHINSCASPFLLPMQHYDGINTPSLSLSTHLAMHHEQLQAFPSCVSSSVVSGFRKVWRKLTKCWVSLCLIVASLLVGEIKLAGQALFGVSLREFVINL
jgi:hypothetical protein